MYTVTHPLRKLTNKGETNRLLWFKLSQLVEVVVVVVVVFPFIFQTVNTNV